MLISITTVPIRLLAFVGDFTRSHDAHHDIALFPTAATPQRLSDLATTTRARP